MLLTSDTAYIEYGQNDTIDNVNTIVTQDSNLVACAGSGIRWQLSSVAPRFFVGRLIHFREP
jgi:hypothetical protein